MAPRMPEGDDFLARHRRLEQSVIHMDALKESGVTEGYDYPTTLAFNSRHESVKEQEAALREELIRLGMLPVAAEVEQDLRMAS